MAITAQDKTQPFPGSINLAYVESMYEDYLRDTASVSPDWQQYFSAFADHEFRFPKPRFGPSFKPSSLFDPPTTARTRVPNQNG